MMELGLSSVRKTALPNIVGSYPEEPLRKYYVSELFDEKFELTAEKLRLQTGCMLMTDGEPVVSVDIKQDVVFTSKKDVIEPLLDGTYRQVLVTTRKNIYVCFVNTLTLSCVRTHQIAVHENELGELICARFGHDGEITMINRDKKEFRTVKINTS